MPALSRLTMTIAGLAGMWTSHAAAACQIKSFAELPVTVAHNRFLVDAAINGKPVKLIFDSGAFGSTLFADAAEKLGLGFRDNGEFQVTGVNGSVRGRVQHLASLTLGRYTLRQTKVIVTADTHGDSGAAGLLGRDQYGRFDVEFDIAHRTIRFLQAAGCSDAQMPYWATTAYSEVPLVVLPTDISAEFRTTIGLNGRPIEVTVDSGASLTVVSVAAANAAGLYARDFQFRGSAINGVGHYALDEYTATFKTVSIDGETIHNVELPITDLFHYSPMQKFGSLIATDNPEFAQGLLGADFLKSHRVLISQSHHMMYFTYEGGLVFGRGAGLSAVAAKPDAPASPAPQP